MATGVKMTAQLIDRGFTAEVDRYYSLDKSYVVAGFPASEAPGKTNRKGSGHEPAKSMDEIVQIAGVHEFGSPAQGIPQRSFFRPALDKAMPAVGVMKPRLLNQILDGKRTIRSGLGVIGEFLVSKIKNEIRTGTFAPLKPSTIARKGSDKPLIDTAQMINSVSYNTFTGRS
jgi:hypothetical protein